MGERFVVCEQGQVPTFQEEPEAPHGRVGSQKLPVKVGVTGLDRGQLLEEEGKGGPGN